MNYVAQPMNIRVSGQVKATGPSKYVKPASRVCTHHLFCGIVLPRTDALAVPRCVSFLRRPFVSATQNIAAAGVVLFPLWFAS